MIPTFERIRSLSAVLKSCTQTNGEFDLEIVVVDDKSSNGTEIKRLAQESKAIYVRNDSGQRERQPALCRNLGFEASSGDIVVFDDADVLLPPNASDRHVQYHAAHTGVVVDAQVWSIPEGEDAIETLPNFTLNELKQRSQRVIQDPDIRWSTLRKGPFRTVRPSDNWWAFLSAQCSFKRADFVKIGRWDEAYAGWGVEDNDIGYRIHKNGLRIIYAKDLLCFHIDHPITREEYKRKCESALRNLKIMCSKYPELLRDTRVRNRLRHLETLLASGFGDIARQETTGGGPIIEPEKADL